MHLKNVPILLLVSCLLFCSGCASLEKSEVQEFANTAVARFSTFFDTISETFSVRSLEKSNAFILEPVYVDWQTSRHYYADLTEKEQLAYRCIYNSIFGHPERIAVPTLSTEELNAVFTALRYDNAQLLFLDDNASLLTAGMSCWFVPSYTMSYWDSRETIIRCADAAKNILQNSGQSESDYEKLLCLHDTLCGLCIYGEKDGRSSQCDGALLQNTATCAGYAKALKLMLDIAGIDSCTVTGNVPDESGLTVSHMWLAVCTDGIWSYCDPTWDDPVAEDGRQTVEHSYFAISQQRLLLTHSDIEMPSHISCQTETTDYYVNNNLFCTQENYITVVAYGILTALQNEKDFAEYRFDSLQTLQEATAELIDAGGIYDLLQHAEQVHTTLQTDRIGYITDEKRLQMKLIFSFE